MMVTVKLIFVFVHIVFSAGNQENELLGVPMDVSISLVPAGTQYHSLLPVIPDFTSCGGPAEVLDWRYEGCMSSSHSGLCQIMTDGKSYQDEFTMVPSEPIPGGLGARFNVSADDIPPKTFDVIIPNSAVRGGQVYTVRTAGSAAKEFLGKIMNFQYTIFRQTDNSVEACAEADFEMI